MGAMTDAVVIISTAPNDEVAAKVARALVEPGIAACVNIVPGVRSIYRWQGKLCDDQERLLVVKTRPERVQQAIDAIKTNHTYECPEAIVLPIIGGAPAYLGWLAENTR
jgi:periplasmic divalent cation tolerance protein